jgi:hypothetical protein
MRSLGRLYLRRAEDQTKRNETEPAKANYAKAVECFEQSLTLNTLQPDTWFSLGCCAQKIDDFQTAARAFRRKVDIEDDVRELNYGCVLFLLHFE